MSKIKLVITDVDGTLVTTEKSLRPSAVAAVRKLHDAGIGFTICSSRPPFGLSAGYSIGYRYSSREKFKSSADGKQKTYNDFDLYPWKFSYIGELQLGWFDLYGSYATRTIFSRGLDQIPYTFGIRIGNW